jgi:spore protease
VVAATKPAAVIAVDALVSRRTSRLGRTVQLADTGIVPGSGVNNARFAVDRRTLGVPVISMGVPTVVEAATLVYDLMESAGLDCGNVKLGELGKESMFVTPRYIDSIVEHAARLAGFRDKPCAQSVHRARGHGGARIVRRGRIQEEGGE